MARPGMHLLSDPTAAAKAFTDACDWCERFSFCTPAADSDLDTWSTWRTIVRNASKLRHAIVALEDLRSSHTRLSGFRDRRPFDSSLQRMARSGRMSIGSSAATAFA